MGRLAIEKAERLMKQAEKFQRPVLTLINTAGHMQLRIRRIRDCEAIAGMLITMSN